MSRELWCGAGDFVDDLVTRLGALDARGPARVDRNWSRYSDHRARIERGLGLRAVDNDRYFEVLAAFIHEDTINDYVIHDLDVDGFAKLASDLKDAAGRGESGEGVLAAWQAMGLRRNGFG